MPQLNFTEEELNQINQKAKQLRFSINKQNLLYPETKVQDVNNFIYCYDFLFYIYQETDNEKIKKYLDILKNIYKEAVDIMSLYEPDGIMQYSIEMRVEEFVRKNSEEIKKLKIEVYPLGRSNLDYDPESAVGIK